MKQNVIFICAVCIVLCVLPALLLIYMTATREQNVNYLISDMNAYMYAGMFLFMGIAPIIVVVKDHKKGG